MSNQNLGISEAVTAVNNNDDDDFNPLTILADVVIQDAARHASLQDTMMRGADTWEENASIEDMHDAAGHGVDMHHSDIQDSVEQGTAGQSETSSSNPNSVRKQVVTADQLYSMFRDMSSSIIEGSSDDNMNDEGSRAETDDAVKASINAKGKGKAKREPKMEGRSASAPKMMEQINAKEKADILRELKSYEEGYALAPEAEAGSTSRAEIEAAGIVPEEAVLVASLIDKDSEADSSREELIVVGAKRRLLRQGEDASFDVVSKEFDFFGSMSNYPELFMELARHLRINDLVSIYAISRDFNETVNGHLSHILKACAAYRAPESSRIFLFTLYRPLCIIDPVGRPDPKNPLVTRMVPSLRWLRMVIHREKCVRDILACMAREGHRMPKKMPLSIKKMWLTMDIPTSARRVQLLHNENYMTDNDLFNLQMFFIKLDMRFNDPLLGSGDDGLRKLMLGQRGLTPLCHLLKRTRFTDAMEAIEACVRYSYRPRPEHRHMPIFGVPATEIGRGHLEGWGLGKVHLYRMDELVMREACRRNLDLKAHILSMVAWGYVNADTNENIQVTREERYMSDDDDMKKENAVIDDGREKPKKHSRKGDIKKNPGKGKDGKDGETS